MSGRTLPDVRPLWQSCSIADNYNIAIRRFSFAWANEGREMAMTMGGGSARPVSATGISTTTNLRHPGR